MSEVIPFPSPLEEGHSYIETAKGLVALRATLSIRETPGKLETHSSVRVPGSHPDGSPRTAFTVSGEFGGVYSLDRNEIPLNAGMIPEDVDLDYCFKITEHDPKDGSRTDHFVPHDCIVGASDEFIGWLMREA